MTRLSLRNPIAILMISIALIVFAAVVVPRLSVDSLTTRNYIWGLFVQR